jgi:cytochrome c oxidase assembly factor CtaG
MSPDATWTFAPGVLLALVVVGGAYGKRWKDARASRPAHPPGAWRLISFTAGLLAVVAALISPIDSLADQLLVMHMIQHLLLLDVAPILLILGLTKVLLRPVTRRVQVIERNAGFLAHPAFAVGFYAGAMCIWHIPTMYDLAANHTAIHAVEHLTFSAAGSLYWWHLLSPIRSRLRVGGMGPVAYMVSTKLLLGVLGIVITFSPGTIYSHYDHGPSYWGLSHHSDQAIAGLVMALEQSVIMGTALAILFSRALAESNREAERAERLLDAGL